MQNRLSLVQAESTHLGKYSSQDFVNGMVAGVAELKRNGFP